MREKGKKARRRLLKIWKKLHEKIKRHYTFASVVVLVLSSVLLLLLFQSIEIAISVCAVLVVFLQTNYNGKINEAKLVQEMNSEFINNRDLVNVEHELEVYFYKFRHEKEGKPLKLNLSLEIENKERQHLVNYLVHLEAVATLINNGVLRLDAINDLIAYRFFIALNNPEVQEIELSEYKEYYSGCFELYDSWSKKMKKNGQMIPLHEYAENIEKIKNGTYVKRAKRMVKEPEKKVLDKIKEYYESESFLKNPTGYFYDLSCVKENVKRLEKSLPSQVHLYYAMKANPHEQVLDCVMNQNFIKGFEIASAGEGSELETALRYCKGEEILFTGPGKTEYELEQAIVQEIRFINVESVIEAARISRIVRRLGKEYVDILLRVNLNFSVGDGAENMAGDSTKMGIDEDVYIDSYQKISQQMEKVRIRGVHAFAASGILDYRKLIEVAEYIFKFVVKLQKKVGKISVIDFGGGLGIDYSDSGQKFDVESYGRELDVLIKKYGFQDKEIIMELGTYIVGNAGYYTAKILDIKMVKGKKHIIIAGGVNHMGLPLEMRRKHPVTIIPMEKIKVYPDMPMVEKEKIDISGPLCIVSDKLAWDTYIEKAEIGDIVLFHQAGAYCYGEGMHQFLMHALPHEVIFP